MAIATPKRAEMKELEELLTWFLYVPFDFIQRLLGKDEAAKRECTEVLVYAAVKNFVIAISAKPELS